MIELGSEVQDILTGFKGIALCRYDHLFNTSEIKIQPRELDDSGKPKEAVWFEESRVEPVKNGIKLGLNGVSADA